MGAAALVTGLALASAATAPAGAAPQVDAWTVDSAEQWSAAVAESKNVELADGMATPTKAKSVVKSVMKTFSSPRSAKSILVEQSPVWKNWEPVKNIGPANLGDAPVMLSLGPDNYWMFGRYRKAKKLRSGKEFEPKPAKLKGFDMPLVTTRWKKQFDAPGGLNNTEKGYHAWQSRDMVNWVHHGQVSEERSRWTTTAEYVDDKLYLYYDYPNDQDPHVYVDDDLFDGKPGRDMGMAFSDPSHGSDCVVIRDLDGKFHLIYEDWSPINAKKRAWDSPLAGHAVSNDGLSDFEILPPAVDLRTTPTGKIKTFKHPHWAKEDPANYPTPVAEYEVHTPEQEAFGDWAAISIGGQYYLFGDFDAHEGGTMSVAWFTSSSLDEPFVKCDNIGEGHPDPDVCFAEGQFYLATQQSTDFVSPGPWVDGVEVRVGVDTDGDATIDQWTDWSAVSESYDHVPGFAKQVSKTPASLDLSGLPEGVGFRFEVKLADTTKNDSKPILDRVELTF